MSFQPSATIVKRMALSTLYIVQSDPLAARSVDTMCVHSGVFLPLAYTIPIVFVTDIISFITYYAILSVTKTENSVRGTLLRVGHSVSFRNSPTPLIPSLHVDNCSVEKFLKLIFSPLINTSQFSQLYWLVILMYIIGQYY